MRTPQQGRNDNDGELGIAPQMNDWKQNAISEGRKLHPSMAHR
jgi:hypothetical protein